MTSYECASFNGVVLPDYFFSRKRVETEAEKINV